MIVTPEQWAVMSPISGIFHSNYYEMIHSHILYSGMEETDLRNALWSLTREANSPNLIIALAC